MRIILRPEYGMPEPVVTSGGSRRPFIGGGLYGFTVHYTGVNVNYGAQDPARAILGIQAYANKAGKPYEYNYVIAQDGRIYEYAGLFRAAHSAYHNTDWLGVLMLNGTLEPLTDAQVASFRWLRHELSGQTVAADQVVPHREQRATACPGELIMRRFPELLQPWQALQPPVVTPPVEEGEEMFVHFVRPHNHHAVYAQYTNGTKRWVRDGDELEVYAFLQGKTVSQLRDEIKIMPNDAWVQATGVIVGPRPSGVDGWGVAD